MTTRSTPRLARWLLNRALSGPKAESVRGDLQESYQRGRSSAWYWRQVLSAILSGGVHDIRHHKLLAMRAAIVGLAAMWVCGAAARGALYTLDVLTNRGFDIGPVRVALSPVWGRFPTAAALVLFFSGVVASGWIVARINPDHRSSMVLTYLASVETFTLLQFLAHIRLVAGVPMYSYGSSGRLLSLSAALIFPLVYFCAMVAFGVLCGGLWACRFERREMSK